MSKILLVEDDDLIREMYTGQLEEAGFEVAGFQNGKLGLDNFRANLTTYDLVLLDIMLPDTNGISILKEIKLLNKDVQVVMLTNLGQASVQQEALGLGARDYMIKLSYNPDQFIAKIKSFLIKSKQE